MSYDETLDDGGPAFPIRQVDGIHPTEPGMSLRDWFAGQAMAAHLSYEHVMAFDAAGLTTEQQIRRVVAKAAYDMADAMLEARKGTSE